MQWQPGVTIEDLERDAICKAFAHFGQNKTKTASALGIAIRTLDAKLSKYWPKEHPPIVEQPRAGKRAASN